MCKELIDRQIKALREAKQKYDDSFDEQLQALEKCRLARKKVFGKEDYSSFTTADILGPGEFVADFLDGESERIQVIVYCHNLYIEVLEEDYGLIIDNQDHESQCLKELEAYLADFILQSGLTPWIVDHNPI